MDAQAWVAFAALLVVLLVQTAAISFWMGGQSARNRSNSHRIDALEKFKDDDNGKSMEIVSKLATLAEKVSNLTDQVQKLERLMEGANRQLSSLTTRRKGVVGALGDVQTGF